MQAENEAQQIGVVHVDVPTEKICPLQVNLEEGTWWKGFQGMLTLGMSHIKEGTDHLLFLIVLLLPAMLLANGKTTGVFWRSEIQPFALAQNCHGVYDRSFHHFVVGCPRLVAFALATR